MPLIVSQKTYTVKIEKKERIKREMRAVGIVLIRVLLLISSMSIAAEIEKVVEDDDPNSVRLITRGELVK